MRRFLVLVVPLVLAGLAWQFNQNYRIVGLDQLRIVPRDATAQDKSTTRRDEPRDNTPASDNETIRVASFNIQVFGESKLAERDVMDLLAKVVRQFDAVAIQEVRSRQQDVLPRFVELINADGGQYDFCIGPRLGRTDSKEQYAVVYNRATLEFDRETLYTVEDADDLLHREPLVATFRARGPDPSEAFTFTIVDMHVDPDDVQREMDVLDDVFRAVRNDGRDEDDILLVGDFNTDDQHLGELAYLPYVTCVVVGTNTNTRRSHEYDNIVLDGRATTEFTGKGGVLDLREAFGLSLDAALRVSDHFPVWAEFSTREGAGGTVVATRSPQPGKSTRSARRGKSRRPR